MFAVGGSSNNVLSSNSVDSLSASMRITTTGNILETNHVGQKDDLEVEEGDNTSTTLNFESDNIDPVEQLNELIAERNALRGNIK